VIGKIKANIHRTFDGNIKTVSITKTQTEKYYASILFESKDVEPQIYAQGKAIGLDLGLTHFLITSEGSKYDNPRHFKKHSHNLKRKQQRLFKKLEAYVRKRSVGVGSSLMNYKR
jgi:putative transposase